MTYTIELDATEEKALEDAARRRGMALDVYLREVLKREAQTNSAATNAATAKRQAQQNARRALQALATGTRAGLPSIPLEAMTSESLYAGRGEITP